MKQIEAVPTEAASVFQLLTHRNLVIYFFYFSMYSLLLITFSTQLLFWFLDASHFPDSDIKDLPETENSPPGVNCHSVLLDDIETRSFTAKNVSFWMQFSLLFKKSFICSIRDQVKV